MVSLVGIGSSNARLVARQMLLIGLEISGASTRPAAEVTSASPRLCYL
jgi:hypothetical protein